MQINLAVVIDGSGSIDASGFEEEKDFAKNLAASFASRNLFANGGAASYVQFGTYITNSTTTYSLTAFNTFVDGDPQSGSGTDINAGIAEARDLLAINPATANFMVVITDGQDENIYEAEEARDEGTVIFAVGVGERPVKLYEVDTIVQTSLSLRSAGPGYWNPVFDHSLGFEGATLD